MADVQSNIHVNIDTSEALASIKLLQKQISAFHSSMAKSGAAAAAVSANMQQNLINSLNATGKFSASMQNVKTTTESFTNSLEKNKLSMRDYYRYSMGATKTFGKFFQSEFDTINKVARERVKDLQTQYIKMGRDANGAMKAIAVRPLALDMQNLGTQTQIAAQRQALLNQLLKQGSTNMLNFGKNTQWAGRQLMVGFTIPLTMLGTTAAKTFMAMEEQAIRFKRVYGELFTTTEETDKMLTDIKLLAKEFTKYGVSVESTMKMAADAAASGKMGADLLAQINEATRLSVLGGVEQEQALETTISLTDAFAVSAENLTKKINFLNSVENQTVVSIEDLTIAIPKAGPVVKQLGGDVEDLAFFLTAMKEGGINASEGANALKSGLAALINPTEKASAMLAEMGINIKGIVEGNQGNVKGVVTDFAQALNTLDPLNRARAIEQLFGKFQFSRLSTLFQNVIQEGNQASRVLQLTKATTEELAILSERELARVEESTTYKFKKTIEDLKVAIAPVGEEFLKAITPIVEFVGNVLEKFNNLSDGAKKFVVILTTLLGGIGPIFLMTFGLLANGLANIIKLFVNIKSVFNRTGQSSKILGDQTSYLTTEQLKASAVASSLNQVHTQLSQTFTSEIAALNALTSAYQRAIAAQRGFGGPVVGKNRKGFADGTKKVKPFYFAKGTDTVPAMLTPGEAVIPAGPAQDPRNKPAISHMIAGGVMQQFKVGTAGAGDFSHIGGMRTVGALDLANMLKRMPAGIISDRAMKAVEAVAMKFANTLKINLYGKLGITTGMSSQLDARGKPVSMNNLMKAGGRGVGKGEFMADWDKRGLDRWKISLRNGGMKMQDVAQDLAILDTHMKDYLTSLDSNTKITDVHVKQAYDHAKRQMGANNKLVQAFEQLALTAGEARINISQAAQKAAGLSTVAGGGSKGAVNVGGMKIRRGGDRFTFYKRTGFSLVDFAEKSMVEGMMERAQVASPSRVTKKVGGDIASGAIIGLKEYVDDARAAGQQLGAATVQGTQAQKAAASRAALYGTGPIDPAQKSLRRQLERQARLQELATKRAYQQSTITGFVAGGAGAGGNTGGGRNGGRGGFFGRFRKPTPADGSEPKQKMGMGGAAMGLSMAAAAGSMAPGKVGEVSQQLMMPLMVLSMLAMMPAKIAGVVAALGVLSYAIISTRMAFDKAQDSMMKLVESTASSSQSIMELSKFAGTVSAGEVMRRRRSEGLSPFDIKPGKTTFGESFVQSETGKATLSAVGQNIKAVGKKQAQADLTNQLVTGVISGSLTPAQARSIAGNIGRELGDYGFGIQVNAKLIELLGPNGENLIKDPLTIRVKMIEETRARAGLAAEKARSAGGINATGVRQIGGGALGGAAAGALAGAVVGSAVPIIGTALGAIAGGIIGGVAGGIIGGKERQRKIGEASGASVAMNKVALEQQQEMIDSLDLEYEKKIENARAAGNQAEAERLTNEYIKNRNALLLENGKTVTDIQTQFEKSRGATREALMTGVDKAITKKYKGTALEDVAPLAKTLIEDSGVSQEQQYTLKMQLATGNIDPMQLIDMMEMFGKDSKTLSKVINIIGKFGGTFANEVQGIASMFKNKKTAAKFIAEIETKSPEEARKHLDLFSDIAKVSNVLDIDVALKYYQENPKAAEKLQGIIDKINEQKGKISLEVAATILGTEEMEALRKDQEYFDSLDPVQQKVYLQTLTTIANLEGNNKEELENWLKQNPGKKPIDYYITSAQKVTQVSTDTTVGSKGGPSSGGGKVDSSPLDELVKKLRDVRKNQIKVTEGWSASRKVLDNLFGGKKKIDFFGGIEQDLTKLGAKGNFIELIVGMDPKEYEKRKNSLFKFDNKGNIIALKKDAKTIQEALNSIVAGDFQSSLLRQQQELKDQAKAYNILREAGVGVAEAHELIADAAFAAMIASEGNSKSAKKLLDLYKRVNAEQKKSDAKKAVQTDIENVKKEAALRKTLESRRYSTIEQIAIMSDESLKQMAQNGQWGPVFQERLQQIFDSIEFKESVFQNGFDKAMERFSAMEAKIEIDFQKTTMGDQDIIEKAQDKIAGLQYQIDDWEAQLVEIEDKEKDINDKYDARFEALDSLRSLNEQISRQQKGQLTLADALSQGDISAAARAAQDIRTQQASDALDAQQKSLEAAKENELANVRNTLGYTRAQIEDQIKGLRDKIFKIEEAELEPAQERVRIEEAKKRELIQSLTVLGKTRLEWEEQKNRIDLAKTASDEYTNAMKAALDIVEDIVKYWESLEREFITTHRIITIYEGGSTGGSTGGNNGTPDGIPDNWDPSAIRKKDEDTSDDLPTSPITDNGKDKTNNGDGKANDGNKKDYTGRDVNGFTPYLNEAKSEYDKLVAKSLTPGTSPSDWGHALAAADQKVINAINLVDAKNDYNKKVTQSLSKGATPSDFGHSLAAADAKVINAANKVIASSTKATAEKAKADAAAKAKAAADLKKFGGNAIAASQFANWPSGKASGGLIKRFAVGGPVIGTDVIPSMLTPGEFVMSRYAVDSFGLDKMKAINNGTYSDASVYNYSVAVNVRSDANPEEIARAVMTQIKQVDSKRLRSNRI